VDLYSTSSRTCL